MCSTVTMLSCTNIKNTKSVYTKICITENYPLNGCIIDVCKPISGPLNNTIDVCTVHFELMTFSREVQN